MNDNEKRHTTSFPETEPLKNRPSEDPFVQEGDNGVERRQKSAGLNEAIALDDFTEMDGCAEKEAGT